MMPKWVPGAAEASRQGGFSLIEMMVVLLIIGIAASLATVSAFGDSSRRVLQQEADRLAVLFATAQTQARATGQVILWHPAPHGYAFQRIPRRLLLPSRVAMGAGRVLDTEFPADSPLRPRQWPEGLDIVVSVQPDAVLRFDADWVHAPLQIDLRSGRQQVQILRRGDGSYEVRQ
ncbi:prepilin-type N-terminal cleavage/methylation domain-containing protein [Castellaniella sp.]|uniref:prepilin-type N-terminal cleavage/methylation domain-containing protein n=1 Tax=Castellaniella sp. TaxID=1955812 RepID=UPI002AFF16B1|nr:prepilin-type N-terminal cleavage/methylation domain-containing protein [Castellaniella sp.]